MSNSPYTAVATSTGDGRAGGRVETSDGRLGLTLGVPEEAGGTGEGTNPEQLFAAGWSACFHSAVKFVAAQKKVTLEDSAVVAEVTLHQDAKTGFSLSGVIRLEIAGVSQEVADGIAAAAHETCPYSKATRGNIEVRVEATVA